jgi:hypothetical protein
VLQNVRAQNFVRFSVGNELYYPFDIFVGHGTAISTKRKLPNSHLHSIFFRLIFRNADAGQLRVGVNDAWDGVVIYVARFSGNNLNASDAFILGLVRSIASNDVIMAQIPSTFVRKCLSTLIRFRSSNSTPTFSAPRPSLNGLRPTDTSALSAKS